MKHLSCFEEEFIRKLASVEKDEIFSIDAVLKEYYFTENQVKAILDMKLQRLTGLEKNRIHEELTELADKIKYYLGILASKNS